MRSNITVIPHPGNYLWSQAQTKIQISLPPGQQDTVTQMPYPQAKAIDQIPALCPTSPADLALIGTLLFHMQWEGVVGEGGGLLRGFDEFYYW